MQPLPSPERLAHLVSNITQVLLGITFEPDLQHQVPPAELRWRASLLPIPGARPLSVGLCSDEAGCRALAAAMFQESREKVDEGMIDDALKELSNMAAGQLKASLGIDQALGLPQVLHGFDHLLTGNGQTVVLKAHDLGLAIWVCEGIAKAA